MHLGRCQRSGRHKSGLFLGTMRFEFLRVKDAPEPVACGSDGQWVRAMCKQASKQEERVGEEFQTARGGY